MADKIVVMNGGNVEQIGAPLDLYDRPNNLFVAGFIGSPAMNFLRGKIAGGAFHAGDVVLPLPQGTGGHEGLSVVYGIRPEHLRLAADGVAATIHVIEPTGAETQVIMRLADTQVVGAFRERIAEKPGQTLHIAPDPALVHLFDEKSGARLN